MSSLIEHAKREFRAAGWCDDSGKFNCEMQEMMCQNVLDLLKVFSEQGHSGSSAPYLINLFEKLAKFDPIVPLTGHDYEWVEVGEGVFQNNRCGRVFKQADRFNGQPYDIDGIVFWEWFQFEDDEEPFKSYFTSSDSFVTIDFPYTPNTVYQFRPTEDFPNEKLGE